jgi:Zn-dependent peptidase ImmA (M78 family)
MLLISNEQALGHSVLRSSLLPIDLVKICALLGLQIEEVEELGGVRIGNPWAERDIKVPGLLDRIKRTIVVSKRSSLAEQRYTLAHELSHSLHHSSPRHLRERAASNAKGLEGTSAICDNAEHKAEERDAEIFASELLMPTDLMEEAVLQRFGSKIDGTTPHENLAHFISDATHKKISSWHLARMPEIERAALFAQADNFLGRHFPPMYRHFQVSLEAMSIRLVELGLIT